MSNPVNVHVSGSVMNERELVDAIRSNLRSEEPETLRREVSVRVAEGGDGRTLEARLVPYNEIATVSDGGDPYQERFVPGAFNAQMKAAHRIKAFLNFRHRQSLADIIGHAVKIEDGDDGLYGELRVLEVPDGDKALALLRAGVLDRLSIEFEPRKSRVVAGVVERVTARLVGVALVPQGSYAGAQVLSVREQDIDEPKAIPESLRPKRLDPELAEHMSARGIVIPDRLKPIVADPDEPENEEGTAS